MSGGILDFIFVEAVFLPEGIFKSAFTVFRLISVLNSRVIQLMELTASIAGSLAETMEKNVRIMLIVQKSFLRFIMPEISIYL